MLVRVGEMLASVLSHAIRRGGALARGLLDWLAMLAFILSPGPPPLGRWAHGWRLLGSGLVTRGVGPWLNRSARARSGKVGRAFLAAVRFRCFDDSCLFPDDAKLRACGVWFGSVWAVYGRVSPSRAGAGLC